MALARRAFGENLRERLHPLAANPVTMVGALIVLTVAVLAFIGPWIVPYSPYAASPAQVDQPPSSAHLFGTDMFGYDVFSRVIYGARYDLIIALGAVVVAVALGSLIGAIAGYLGSFPDELLMRIMDVVQSFPGFILAMGIAAALGPDIRNVIIAIGLTNVPIYARLMRSKLMTNKQSGYVMAAKCVGNSWERVLFVHLLPNSVNPLFVQATLQCGWAILSAAGLSFIGLGVRVPDPEWGVMISMGVQRIVIGKWWTSFFPGLAIVFTVMGFNLLGDGLQDVLDPRRRK